MHSRDKEALETIDAMVFSGDTLLDPDNRAEFREYLNRWLKQVDVMQGIASDIDAVDNDEDESKCNQCGMIYCECGERDFA